MTTPRFHIIDAKKDADAGWYDRHTVPEELRDKEVGAEGYEADGDLVDACNIALALGSPLLITGDPGTGKTQLAWWLARRLGARTLAAGERGTGTPTDLADKAWTQPFALYVKSSTTWRDLLYQFDTVRYFHDGMERQQGRKEEVRPIDYVTPGPLWKAIQAAHAGVPSVVLIDEIDKAPRDFSNDLLHELDAYELFVPEVPELAGGVRPPKGRAPPLVIVTSNNERRLPDAFLRRCVFHHIRLSKDIVTRAVNARRAAFPSLPQAVVDAAIGLLLRLADPENREVSLSRRPGTAELLAWLAALDRLWGEEAKLAGPADELPAIGTMVKDREDREELKKIRV